MQVETGASILEIIESDRIMTEMADSRTQDWQKRIGKGDCFKRWTPDGLEIYGEVLGDYETKYLRNFRICRCYSMACPEGEIGQVHVSTVNTLIDRETFEAVRNKLGKAWRLALKKLKEEEFL